MAIPRRAIKANPNTGDCEESIRFTAASITNLPVPSRSTDAVRLDVIAPDTESGNIVVSGSGSAIVHGVYEPDGTLGGKVRYTIEGGITTEDSIEWFDSQWWILSGDVSYFKSLDNVATPDLVVTWELAFSGIAPVPQVNAGLIPKLPTVIGKQVITADDSAALRVLLELGNVDNTSDANKPVSTAAQTALDLKAPIANPAFTGTVSGITKAMIGLSNADNTSDAAKPVSTAQQAALDLKANTSVLGTAAFTASTDYATAAQGADTRTPTDGTVTNAKVAADAAIAESKLALASDAAAATASRRTLGTGATQAAPGNDSRFNVGVYSTTEKEIGTYNGATLYGKSIFISSFPNNTITTYAHGISGGSFTGKSFKSISGHMGTGTNSGRSIPWILVTGGGVDVYAVDATNITVATDLNLSAWSGYIDLTYTK